MHDCWRFLDVGRDEMNVCLWLYFETEVVLVYLWWLQAAPCGLVPL